jgi:hypothetical protein
MHHFFTSILKASGSGVPTFSGNSPDPVDPVDPPSPTYSLDDSLIVMVGASNIEGNAGDTPADFMLDFEPFDTNGTAISNQGFGGHSFDYGVNALSDSSHTDVVQALQGTATGMEILLIAGDPAVNELLASRSTSEVQTSWASLVDWYRANGWTLANNRALIVATCQWTDDDGEYVDIQTINTYIRNNWSSRADGYIDIGANPWFQDPNNATYENYLVDAIHLTEAGATNKAELFTTGIENIILNL